MMLAKLDFGSYLKLTRNSPLNIASFESICIPQWQCISKTKWPSVLAFVACTNYGYHQHAVIALCVAIT